MRRSLALAINGTILAVVAVVAVAAGVHFESSPHPTTPPTARAQSHAGAAGSPSAKPTPPKPPLKYLGVYEPTSPGSYAGVTKFAGVIGRRPNIAVYYSSWFEQFQRSFADAAHANGATPMVQVEPTDISLARIANGDYDSYLRSYARSVRAFGFPVILAFGHEMNANWYGWGYQHTSPATFIAAWRHVHNVFTEVGATKVIWLWVVNVVGGSQTTTISQWWPGDKYVTWVGIDGHYFNATVDFEHLYVGTLGLVRQFTKEPVLVSEVGIAPQVSAERIEDVFDGARAHGMIGLVWFDEPGHNIQVADHPAAISAFRIAVSRDEDLPVVPLTASG